jgi:SagB-type dehydrogenase family enzyme
MPRNQFKYAELGYRLMVLEAGHLAQNILLVAQAQGLGTLPVCGFYDDRMHDFLEIDGVDEVCLYLLVIGHPNRA